MPHGSVVVTDRFCTDTVTTREGSAAQPPALNSADVHRVTIPVRVPEPGPYVALPAQAATRQGTAAAAMRRNAGCQRGRRLALIPARFKLDT